MPTLSDHQSNDYVKFLYIGDSGTGKTGSLVSLLEAGYKLRILDLDNGLDALKQWTRHKCPQYLDNVIYETVRDKYRATVQGPTIVPPPKAYVNACKLMTQWTDETVPSEWGPDTIFVLDSLTMMGRAALAWAEGMAPTVKDPRQWFNTAQRSIENILAMLTSEDFHANVIVISHVTLFEMQTGEVKGYPSAVGKALGPQIAKYFNTLVLAETSGMGKSTRRKIKTMPTGIIDLKTPASFKVDSEYDLEDGMAKLFNTLKEN